MTPIAPADGLIAGHGMIEGRPVLVGAEDFTVMGGSIGIATHAKRLRLAELSLQERVPLVMLLEGAGERAQNAFERYPHAPNDLQALVRLRGVVPTVAVVMGASAGHGALTAPLMDLTIMVEGAALFSAGPPLVAAAIGEVVSKEALDLVLDTVDALIEERGEDDTIWGSMVKQALKRRKPGFNESYYGFRSFNDLLEEAYARHLLDLERDKRSGGYIVRLPEE